MSAPTLFVSVLSVFIADAGFAAGAASVQRYQLSGTGSITREAVQPSSERFKLSADLGVRAPGPSMAPASLTGGGFVLSAVASQNSLVCYNDTIFRDGFDGTGL